MSLAAALGFALVAFLLIIVPGPDWAFVLAAGARDCAVLAPVAGLCLGYLLVTIVVAAGVGPLFVAFPPALTALTIAGAAYLLHLGVRTLRGASTAAVEVDLHPAAVAARRRYVRRGAGVSALNPKSVLLFVAVLPQFAHPDQPWPLPVQLGVLGLEYIAITIAFLVPLGHAASRVLGSSTRIARATSLVTGVAMLLAGAALLLEGVLSLV